MMTDDHDLLRRFAENADEAAFTELVGRHLSMVHGICRRRTGDPQLAEELAQNVFAALARKAGTIRKEVLVAGWLHRASCMESLQALRAEASRKKNMNRFKELQAPETGGQELPPDLVPVLDEAMDRLAVTDRDVVLMRFASGLTLRQIGDTLGKSESAAQRHLQRALENLCGQLRRRGVTVGIGALAAFLGADLAKAVPASLVTSTFSKAAIASSATGGVSVVTLLTTALFIMKQKALIATGIFLLLAAGSAIYLSRDASERESVSGKGSALPRGEAGKASEAATTGEGSASGKGLRKRSQGQDSELVKRFGESRVKLARNTAEGFVGQMETMARIMEFTKQDKNAIDTSRVETALNELYQKLVVSDAQKASLDALVAKQMDDEWEQMLQAPAKIRKGQDRIVEALLTGDAVARGKVPTAEYEPLVAGLDEELGLLAEYGTAAGLLSLKGEWEKILEERQWPLFEQGLLQLKKQADETRATSESSGRDFTDSPNKLLSKPRSLEELSDEISRQKKMVDGIAQAVDAMKGK